MKPIFICLLIVLNSEQIFSQQNSPIKLIEYEQSDCDESSDPYRLNSRIISVKHIGDTLDIEIGFAAMCCIEYSPRVKFEADTLFIRYEIEGDQSGCLCACCYSFHHKLKGINSSKFTVKLYDQIVELSNEKYKIYPVTYTILKGDTVNLKDKYGLKQGIWISGLANFTKYTNDKIHKWGHLDNNGRIKDEYDSWRKLYKEYYKSGKLKKECLKDDSGHLNDCRQWRRNGKEIKPKVKTNSNSLPF